jgi:hypothetical protein
MTEQWPIQVKDATGVVRVAGHAKGVPPISGALGVLQIDVPFDLPGLDTGIAIGKKSPVAPEMILAAWFDLIIPWDVGAVTPKGDIYTPQIMGDWGEGLIAHAAGSPASMRAQEFNDTTWRYNLSEFFWPKSGAFTPLSLVSDPNQTPHNAPWYFVVSRDGTPTGGDPGASNGHALLNILLARST